MRCPACQAENDPSASKCACGAALASPRRSSGARRRRNSPEEADAPFSVSAQGPNRRSVHAYRVCLVALVPFVGLLLGPVAFVLGLIAYRRDRADPGFGALAHVRAAILGGAAVTLLQWLGLALMLLGLRSRG
jgi:hypothetical protein